MFLLDTMVVSVVSRTARVAAIPCAASCSNVPSVALAPRARPSPPMNSS
jgi:hypothetical protein